MSEIKVSVLIPVYNVEEYVEQCVRSLFEQSITEDIEYIFTDDCSPDSSMEIIKNVIEDYPHRKAQVKFLRHHENLGLAEARNTGLRAARGKYVIHCDSDDWVREDMYASLLSEAERTDADITLCDYVMVTKKGNRVIKQDFSNLSESGIEKMLDGKGMGAYLWQRLIKREFYIKRQFRADASISLLEDMAVSIPMHMSTDRIAYVSQPLYYYRCTDASSMSSVVRKQDEVSRMRQDNGIRSALSVLLSFEKFSFTSSQSKALRNRIERVLFSRTNISSRNIEAWRNLELPVINSLNFPVSKPNRLSVYLLSRRLDVVQYLLVLIRKIFNPNVVKLCLSRRM